MTDHVSITAFRRAEQAYWQSNGVQVTERTIPLARLALAGRVLELGEGSPVLMVHGGGGLATGWVPLMAHLNGHRLLAVDRPGFGLTDFVDYRAVDLRAHAIDFLDDVLDALGIDQVSVVANSMGGLWCLWYALARPTRIARLALLGTPALILNTSAPGPMRLLGIPGLNRLLLALEPPSPQQVRRLWKRMGHDPQVHCSAELIELVMRLEQLPAYGAAWRTLLENVVPFGRVRPGIQLSEETLGQVGQPVLYVWGRRDPFGSVEVARQACAATPRAELQIIGEGHFPWVDEPKACAVAVHKFLRGAL